MTEVKDDPFLNDLSLSLKQAWELLRAGAADRHSPLHTPVVATVTGAGTASQRIMVLRAVDQHSRRLRFNTDLRGSKVAEVGRGASVSLLGYHPEAKVQLRLSGKAEVQSTGPDADAAWEQASLYGQRCYLAEPAPGSPVDAPTSGLASAIEGVKPTPDQVRTGRTNFAILLVEVETIEWLYLAHRGHRRARFHWNAAAVRWEGIWLVP
ncbi:pyridoxamine 5'-phosphate oxidase family protein [Parasphingorhabdus sp.]|uniref:pyridoxamine 5'-phosphate oxidase family protein n=1 Tax=Parasphingorhabdus sp. TaxID=2709688 RepID=UPI00359342BA